jgi:hypothetical protein
MTWGQRWQIIFGFLYAEKIVIALMVTSAVKTFPLPGQPFKVYTFFYDWSHQFFNITNTRLSSQPVITPPQPAPEPKP